MKQLTSSSLDFSVISNNRKQLQNNNDNKVLIKGYFADVLCFLKCQNNHCESAKIGEYHFK